MIVIPIARVRGFMRGMTWSIPAVILGLFATSLMRRIDFTPTGISSRLVDAGLAVLLLPALLFAAICAWQAGRWILFGAWFDRLGVFVHDDELTFKLGPWGTRRFPVHELDVRYPFELTEEESDGAFERFLPEDEQRRSFLPRIRHPSSKIPLDRLILHFARGSETEIAALLGSNFDRWRSRTAGA